MIKGLQSYCIPQLLFNIYIWKYICLRNWTKKCKPMEDPVNLHRLLFTDDQVIITQDNNDATYVTQKLVKEYKKWD